MADGSRHSCIKATYYIVVLDIGMQVVNVKCKYIKRFKDHILKDMLFFIFMLTIVSFFVCC